MLPVVLAVARFLQSICLEYTNLKMTPDEFTNKELMLPVGDGHKLYVHDWGKKDAKYPIVFLHGGPGNGFSDGYKQRFVPTRQRVIFFDQRGSGKSTPGGSVKHNTTQDIVEDIQKITNHLKLQKFIVAGGSWGSCLAFAYAIKYPEQIHAMVLGGIFTGTQAENDFLFKGGYQGYFPDVWDDFLARTPKEHHNDPYDYHIKQAFSTNKISAKKSIYAFAQVEHALLRLDDRFSPDSFEEFDPNGMKIEMHYIKNNCFLPENYIQNNAHKLKMPIWMVQGRYDSVCPPITAYNLHKKLPNSELIWTTAGHANDRANYDVARTLLLSLT